MMVHNKGTIYYLLLDFVQQKFMNLLMMEMGVKNYKLMHKIVYIAKLVILK
jgi:hypothetical protein